ncbi:hypothetical protein GGQ91_003275 [Methylobacterium fujisawaense]|uniref:Apea-like HEPN domain-containing protein n=1 Tax=Methylobacterium fujisawaense TaxID=107400 RepID=A0ABR6DCQ9_9HYPH|nr:HEPN domain-containing protein [Methylobacterium fujisawaense]MBA9063874.1 hypothetical protein [Methylobacterium fujisawaense]
MLDAEKINRFRNEMDPIAAFWRIGDQQAYGSLVWRNGEPQLILVIELDEQPRPGFGEPDHPLFVLTRPPLQASIVGIIPQYGTVFLKRCARYNWRNLHNLVAGRELFELSFQPTEIWMGAEFEDTAENIISIGLQDTRLAGFFGNPGLTTLSPHDPNAEEAFRVLGSPESIWTFCGPAALNLSLGETGFSFALRTQALRGWAATTGATINSLISIDLYTEKAVIPQITLDISWKIEQIISVLSLEPFTFEYVFLHFSERSSVGLVWRYGEDRSIFKPPMQHQLLVDLANVENLALILDRWFRATEVEQLSRWIFVRALHETSDGLARFVSVSQALEVLGREFGAAEKMPKSMIKLAVAKIRAALSSDFEKTFIDRVAGLVGSSNKTSYRDVLTHMITQAAQRHFPEIVTQIPEFAKTASETRNAVVHMSSDDKAKLQAAFDRVNKYSLKLCFWYAVVEMHYIGIEMPNIRQFLFNNRNARHGLPNEVLERH